MRIPESLHDELASVLGSKIQSIQPCAGGDINDAYQLQTVEGSYFMKWHRQAPQGMFAAEARGLELLKAAGPLRVPAVVAVGNDHDQRPAYLVLEWLKRGRATSATDEVLGRGLAALHQQQAEQHGLDHENFIGPLRQPNRANPVWSTFYGQQRIRPQMEIARTRGRLSSGLESMLESLITRLPDLVPEATPSLLHGDLWRGNVMVLQGGEPAIIDPAVYYGHREVELAFTELFGGFSQRFYDAYDSVYPIDKDYPERRALYQLYPLMVHMNLFGGGYTARVESIARQYA